MIQVANAPCSWGVLEFDGLEGEAAGCEQFLRELKQSGYVGTELGDWGFMPTDPGQLSELLARFELPLLGAFVPVALTEPAAHAAGFEVATRTAKLLAQVNPDAFIVLADDNGTDPVRTLRAGRILGDVYDTMGRTDALSPAFWHHVVHGAEEVARRVRDESGLRTVFHHHCAGWVETADETARLLDRTDPTLLGLCFDTGHWAFAGGDPVAGLTQHRERIWHVHFKDHDPTVHRQSIEEAWPYFESVRNGIFCELGRGDVDFSAVLQTLRRTGYDGWIVVEQDVLPGMGAPLDSATRNRQFLYDIGL